MHTIGSLIGREILDSRGRPTVEATCVLGSGASGTCSVPSGASTGSGEAIELRDGDLRRYRGLGCRRAASHISQEIFRSVAGSEFAHQSDFDRQLITLDGTPDKSRLGANALLASSLAFARAVAAFRQVPLYRHFADLVGLPLRTLPQLTINLYSGGKHAGGQVPIQDVLMVPTGASSIDDGLAMASSVYQEAAGLILEKYGMRMLRADEGGLAPPFPNVETMLSDSVAAIQRAGLVPGVDMSLAIDVASTHFYEQSRYRISETPITALQMINQLEDWVSRFPIVSVEDGLAEDDWEHWPMLRQRLGDRVLILGDDLLCTNIHRIERAVRSSAATALLLKVNQIGTLSEAAASLGAARAAGWKVTVSARSGETEDNWLADLAVGWSGDQIKVGSITQSERLAKYNRLLAIEAETGLPVNGLNPKTGSGALPATDAAAKFLSHGK